MSVSDKITERVRQLPEQTQVEVLDFVEYLLAKTNQEKADGERKEWSRRSLASALRGMEGEDEAEYSMEDLEKRFSSS